MVNFKESQYKFTDPIRYFKENDPYYWEIDNLPLKQLQENVLWLKDQIDVIPTPEEANTTTGVNRADFNELKPSANSTNNVVTVNSGRYTARINDAYDLTPLQKIIKLSTVIGESSKYQTEFGVSSLNPNSPQYNYVALLNSFLIDVNSDALNLNGLIERVTVWDNILYNLTSVQFVNGKPANANWPILEIAQNVKSFLQDQIPGSEPLASEFVKQFRGVARTAVVDVPEQLSIEIPSFNEDDFFIQTVDGNGNVTGRQPIVGASKRIDLLFIYSKPVDSTETTIQKWIGGTISTSGTPVKITKPILGLIKGAGVGGSYMSVNQSITPFVDNSTDYTSILPNVSDELDPNNGFQSASLNIHGSFPSPDDLMNLAPMIQEKFESNDPRLIGQTILPIAYVVVRRDASIGSNGAGIVRSSDIIDIRPFFRTTELTYGERSGICAATPSISLANPVATKYNLEKEISDLKQYADSTYELRQAVTNNPKVAAAGYIFGGTAYGPERFMDSLNNVPTGWDLSYRIREGRTQYHPSMHYVDMGAIKSGNMSDNRSPAGNENEFQGTGDLNGAFGIPLVWNKTIEVTGIQTTFSDFFVEASFHNCFPQTGNGVQGEGSDNDSVDSKYTGIYVIKRGQTSNSVKFTIIATASLGYVRFFTGYNFSIYDGRKPFNLFQVKNIGTGGNIETNSDRLSPFSSCFYPSVKYTVTLTPQQQSTYSSNSGTSQIESYI
jgi:hypothetical protein